MSFLVIFLRAELSFSIFESNSIRSAAAISLQQKRQRFSHAAVWTAAWWGATWVWTCVRFMFPSLSGKKTNVAALNIWSRESVFFFFLGVLLGRKKKERNKTFLLWASHQRLSFTSRLSVQIKWNVREHPKRIFLAEGVARAAVRVFPTCSSPLLEGSSLTPLALGVFSLLAETLEFSEFHTFSHNRRPPIGLAKKSKSRRPRKVKHADLSLWPPGAQLNFFFFFFFLLEPFVPLTLRRVGAVTPERSRPVRVAALPLVLGENRGREDSNSILCATPSNPPLYL